MELAGLSTISAHFRWPGGSNSLLGTRWKEPVFRSPPYLEKRWEASEWRCPHSWGSSAFEVPNLGGGRQTTHGSVSQPTSVDGSTKVGRSLECHVWHPKRRHRCLLKSTRASLLHAMQQGQCRRCPLQVMWTAPEGVHACERTQ